jgi:hypothetical protein
MHPFQRSEHHNTAKEDLTAAPLAGFAQAAFVAVVK